jgi:5'-3' exonuclease
MGIKQLLKFINTKCPNSSKIIHLSELSGKKIVIDTSIYMYKFKINGELFDNFYLFCMLLLEKSILPVFVFDGPKSFYKRHTLEIRYKNKVQAMENLKSAEKSTKQLYHNKEIKNIKKKCMRITLDDIKVVKELLTTLGIMYIDAPYEADEICAKLVLEKQVYACLSDDTDMFAYGCSKILTNIDLFQETVTMYSMSQILRSLRITQTTFRELCVLAGTDYNKSYGSMQTHYDRYQEYKQKKTKKGYLQWLFDTGHINAIIYLSKIYLKYDLFASNFNELKVFENISLYKNDIFESKLKLLLRKHYFINP